MAKKLTYEEVKEYIESQGYKLLSKEYVNARTKMTLEDEEGYLYITPWNNFRDKKQLLKFHKSNPYTIQNIKQFLKLNAEGYELLSTEYIGGHEKLIFKCPKGHEFEADWHHFQLGRRCPYCSIPPRKIELGINTIWDTDRWMIEKLGVSEEDAKTHTKCSNDKIQIICPNCGKNREVQISDIYGNKSNGCSCGDGVSYNEKFIISLLDQLNIKYKKEYKTEWSNNRRYDFYFEYNDKKYIVECNGEQHYKQTTRKGDKIRTLQEEQENDRLKEQLALNNGIEYIIIDCRYSELNWIKDNILKSKLSEIFDLINNINWIKCEEFALSPFLVVCL